MIVARIHDAYVGPWVNEMGGIMAEAGPLLKDVPREEWPPVIAECWKLPEYVRRRTMLDPATGKIIPSK